MTTSGDYVHIVSDPPDIGDANDIMTTSRAEYDALLYTKIWRFMHLSVKYTITKNCVGACQRYGNRRKREQ